MTPTFKVDENLPEDVVEVLKSAGYDALSVPDQGLQGTEDPELLQLCAREERTLVTLDLDFADIRSVAAIAVAGVIVIRLPRQDRDSVVNVVRRLLPLLDDETLRHSLWIAEADRVRIRRVEDDPVAGK